MPKENTRRSLAKAHRPSPLARPPIPVDISTYTFPADASTLSPLGHLPPPSLSVLLNWFKSNDIVWDQIIEIRSPLNTGDEEYGWSAWVKDENVAGNDKDDDDEEDLRDMLGTAACKIPRQAILSVKHSDLRTVIPQTAWKQLPHIVRLSLTVLYELRRWEDSRWFGYLQSLPREPVPLATLWDLYGKDGKQGLELLKDTEFEREIKRIKREGHGRQDLEVYHSATRSYFPLTSYFPNPPTLTELLHCYSLVSSRAFQVDHFHGTALVPLADIFNHTEDAHLAFETDDFACEECGNLSTCEHDEDVENLPVFANDPASPMVAVAPRLSHLPLEIVASLGNPLRDTLDMTFRPSRGLKPGQQVYNSYGDKIPWTKTLAEWGFIDGDAEKEGKESYRIHWDVSDLLDKNSEDFSLRRSIWKKAAVAINERPGERASTRFVRADPELEPKDSLYIDETGTITNTFLLLAVVSVLPAEYLARGNGQVVMDTQKIIVQIEHGKMDVSDDLVERGIIVHQALQLIEKLIDSKRLVVSPTPVEATASGPLSQIAHRIRLKENKLLESARFVIELLDKEVRAVDS